MLYKEVYIVLDSLASFLRQRNIAYPEQLSAFNKGLKECLDTGRNLTAKELECLESHFFPDAGMGWINDLQYELEGEDRKKVQDLTDKFYKLWKDS